MAADQNQMRACVLSDVRQLAVQNVPLPELRRANEVLLRVSAVGLCGTDWQIFDGHANYNTDERGQAILLRDKPQILGHEIVGEIVETGAGVTDLSIGNRVVVDQGINCSSANREIRCEYCASGDSHQCEFYREHGLMGLPGGLAEFLAIPAVNAVKIESNLHAVEAALTEPLACVLHSSETVSRATTARYAVNHPDEKRRVQNILIFGAGPAGLLFIQYLREVLGFDGKIIVSEPNDLKREKAENFGAVTTNPRETDLTETVREETGGRMIEYAIEASGVGAVFHSLPALVRKQATVLLYGHGHAGVDLSIFNNLMFKEPALIAAVGASGGFDPDGRPAIFRRALSLIETEQIQVAPFITHRYDSLERSIAAFYGENARPDYLKGVVALSSNCR